MTLLKDNNYKDINVALLSLEADIKNKVVGFDTSVISKQLAEINSRIDKINAGNNNSSAEINDIRYEIENINSKLNAHSVRIESIEQKLSEIFSAENKVTDFNTTTNSGIYYWMEDAANRPTDYGVLLVNKFYNGSDSATGLWINQIAYGTNNRICFRQNINTSGWTEWKAVASLDDIEQKMSGIFLAKNNVTDLNTTTDAGTYYWGSDSVNGPTDYGVLLVNKYDGESNGSLWINQIAYGTDNKIYFRQNINRMGWTGWKAVAFEG